MGENRLRTGSGIPPQLPPLTSAKTHRHAIWSNASRSVFVPRLGGLPTSPAEMRDIGSSSDQS